MDLYLISAFIFIIGTAVGSFVNVVALRMNTGLSFIKGDSRCLACNTKIQNSDLVPIFSYINLSGRCAACKSRLPLGYFLVEIFSGLALLLLYLKFSLSSEFFLLTIIYYFLATIFIYDLRHKIIPDPLVFGFLFLSFLYAYFVIHNSIFYIFFSALLVPLPFFIIWLFSKGRLLGFGDIKLMAGLGALLGLNSGIMAVFISFWIGAVYVIILWVFKRKFSMKSEVPFAPFLILGTIVQFIFQFKLF